jgi:hypothetical protein
MTPISVSTIDVAIMRACPEYEAWKNTVRHTERMHFAQALFTSKRRK